MTRPVRDDKREGRRIPWLSVALVAACAAVFVHTSSRHAQLRGEVEEARDAVESYLNAHPYLALDPRVAQIVFPGLDPEGRHQHLADLARRYPYRVFDFQYESDQPRLDALSEELLVLADSHPLRHWGLTPAYPTGRAWLAHMFVHASWPHLLGNLLLLLLAGSLLEARWGRPLYLGCFLLGGLVSAASFQVANSGVELPLVGASGATAALTGALLLRFGTLKPHAWLLLALWVGTAFLGRAATDPLAAGVGAADAAHWGNLGGFAIGAAVAVGARLLGLERRHLPTRGAASRAAVSGPATERTHAAHGRIQHETQSVSPDAAPLAHQPAPAPATESRPVGAPTLRAGTDEPSDQPGIDSFGVVDLATSDDASASDPELAGEAAPTPFELGSTFDLADSDESEGGAGFLQAPDDEKPSGD